LEITVFTPTYNRAYTLQRLYDSLLKQNYTDFEWLIIDDGSTDNTEELVNSFVVDCKSFSIRYYQVENGGKHRAINKALTLANGRLFYIVDSDDYLPDNSLQSIIELENTIPADKRTEYAGIAGIRTDINSALIGKTFDGEICDCTYLEATSNNIHGDKAEVYYTEVLRRYPFPEFENEKFIPESVVWNIIAADGYKLRYFNKNIYNCEYQKDGLTAQVTTHYSKSPKGYGLLISQRIKYGKLVKLSKWKTIFDYYRTFNGKASFKEIATNLDMNTVYLYFRILGIRIFYKLYNR